MAILGTTRTSITILYIVGKITKKRKERDLIDDCLDHSREALIFFHDAEPDVIVPAILSPEKVLNCLRHLID